MKYSQVDKRKSRQHMNLDNLDHALHDLGMLSTVTDARRDYLRESKSDYCMMRLNTRYVSNVTVGYCMKRTTTKNRLCPYVLPVRHRTKSENSDALSSEVVDSSRDFKPTWMESSTSGFCKETLSDSAICPAKRCQSLENLNLSDSTPAPETSPDPTVDCVSIRIQKLQVDE